MTFVKKYKMIRNYNGSWSLYCQYVEGEKYVYIYGSSNGNLSYNQIKSFYDNLKAMDAYVPIELTPPFPDTDPTAPTPVNRKFFKWFF